MVAPRTTTYPTGFDSIVDPVAADTLATPQVEHDNLHAWTRSAILALETKLGLNNSVNISSVDYVLKNHTHQGTDGSQSFSQVVIKNSSTPLVALKSWVGSEANERFSMTAAAIMKWGPGITPPDVTLSRSLAGRLGVDGSFQVMNTVAGNVALVTQGATGQSTNLFAARDDTGTNVFTISAVGALRAFSTSTFDGLAKFDPGSAVTAAYFGDTSQAPGGVIGILPYPGNRGIVIRQPATSPSSLIQGQASDGTVIYQINSSAGVQATADSSYFGGYALTTGTGVVRARVYTVATGNAGVGIIAESDVTIADVDALLRPKGAGAARLQSNTGTYYWAFTGDGKVSTSQPAANLVTTVGAAGGASALPATPLGYMIVTINGTDRKIPYYNV